MKRSTMFLASAVLLVSGSDGLTPAAGHAARAPKPFAVANVHFEQNATDGDVEVVFEVKGGADGLTGLSVIGPDGRTVMSFESPDAGGTSGLRKFLIESPEPRDAASLKAAYPEGAYVFAGWTAKGDTLTGQSTLSHQLPPIAALLRPKSGATGVATKGLQIAWSPVANVAAYVVKIEQEDLGESVEARILVGTSQFAVPDGFLRPGREYVLGISTISDKGNLSAVETTFTTARTTAGTK
jgi:hypothetical protein